MRLKHPLSGDRSLLPRVDEILSLAKKKAKIKRKHAKKKAPVPGKQSSKRRHKNGWR